jgi:hypothetical protein
VQGSTRHDRGKKPEGLRAEASGSAERWPSEADYSFTYRDCELVMNAQPHYHVLDHGNVVFFAVRSNSQEDVAGRLRMNRTTVLSHMLGLQPASPTYALSRSSTVSTVSTFQLHHFKFWQRRLLTIQRLTEPRIWPGSCP